jgi:RNA polymerase sigma-70 factor, ECF subfamily
MPSSSSISAGKARATGTQHGQPEAAPARSVTAADLPAEFARNAHVYGAALDLGFVGEPRVAAMARVCYPRLCVVREATAESWSEEPALDAELVARMARGDREAAGELYDRHSATLFALALRILGARGEAEDLVHDVFLEAWRHAAEYDPARASVRAWLAVRTRSRALDCRKSARVSRSVGLPEEWLESPADSAREPGHVVDQGRLRHVLVALPPEQREVLVLGYFEGLSSSEIAERLALPIGTVKSRVAAALGRLRAAFGGRRP